MSEENHNENHTPDPVEPAPQHSSEPLPQDAGGDDVATRQWAMFIHFSVLAGWVVPLAGLVVPVLLWQMKKDEMPGIVPHAHVVMNWIISSLIYGFICFILIFLVIGIFGFFLLGLLTVIYAIVGGVKANNGELWEYPGTLIKVF